MSNINNQSFINLDVQIPLNSIDTNNDDTQPKKRGRKPKTKELIITSITNSNVIDGVHENSNDNQNISAINQENQVDDDNQSNIDTDINDDGSMKTKRRGRKPKDKFKYECSNLDEYQKNNRKEDNVIIKLPLSCLKLNEEFNIGKDLFPYNPNISTPKPYNPEHKNNIGFSLLNDDNEQNENDNNYENINSICSGIPNNINTSTLINLNEENKKYCSKCSNCECNKNISFQNDKQPEARQIDIILNNKYNSNTDKFNVLTHLGTSLNGTRWLEKNDVSCLWCCHQFKTTPWGIPFKFVNDKFQLFGNFCMPNCALAYILQNYKDDDLWEKVALLNLLFFKVCGQYKNITPAFDKMALKMFGGTLEIEEYREIVGENEKSYSIEFPPCNTIIPMLEEIYKKTNLNNTFIPVDKSRIQVANNELKLKRSKPVVNHKNTLDFCLGKVNS
jgi:thiol-disulfide isomerase/thioredoxin